MRGSSEQGCDGRLRTTDQLSVVMVAHHEVVQLSKKTRTMIRSLLLTFLLFTILSNHAVAQEEVPGAQVEALVTLRLEGATDEMLSTLRSQVGKEPGTTLEYTCVRSGIVILYLRSLSVTEKADVLVVVKRILREAGIRTAIDFLDVHVELAAGNKC